MSDPNAEQEPSMEEILASIRRIISEDGDEDTAEEAGREPEPPAEHEEGVLELTDEVQDDGTVVNLKTGEEVSEGTGRGRRRRSGNDRRRGKT